MKISIKSSKKSFKINEHFPISSVLLCSCLVSVCVGLFSLIVKIMPDLAEMNETEDLFDLNTGDNSYQTESNINSW